MNLIDKFGNKVTLRFLRSRLTEKSLKGIFGLSIGSKFYFDSDYYIERIK